MFIKNKRFSYPKSIEIDGNMIQIVDSFKLLGVTIDCKLNFISCTKKLININL